MLQDDVRLVSAPARTLLEMRSLGVGIVRLTLTWSAIAPDPRTRVRPAGFRAANPAAYPSANWAPYDAIVRDALRDGVRIDLVLTSPGPLWATGAGAPRRVPVGTWRPSPAAYGRFVKAVATRYSGHYVPPGSSSPLPPVHFWEIWNEPNWGPMLSPQFRVGSTRILSAPRYRGLLDAAWTALQSTGHGGDTIVIANLSPRGIPEPPESVLNAALQASSPIGFTQTLYCADSSFHPLRGNAALRAGCAADGDPTQFRQAHPALFEASGYGIHPYPIKLPPTEVDASSSDTVEFPQIPILERTLDRLQGMYGSHTHLSIYNTEYGYITHPPNVGTFYVAPATAAHYLNWAEYLTWRNPRIATTMQYGLFNGKPGPTVFGTGGFATALIFYGGKPSPTFYAYRMPLFLPVTRAPRGHDLEVWGCARPATYAYLDTRQPQYVQIQWRPESGGRFQTIRSVRLNAALSCYFDLEVHFPASGTVRLRWSYPIGDRRLRNFARQNQRTIYSRRVTVTVR